jgi:diguanylate cyclase (GGDEF)-like protein
LELFGRDSLDPEFLARCGQISRRIDIMEPVHVLLAEDEAVYAHRLDLHLKQAQQDHFFITRAARLEEAIHLLEHQTFDIALADLNLPDSKGLQTFRTLRQYAPHMPIILLTGDTDESIALQLVKEGAEDYIVKGEFPEKYLFRAIHYAIERNALKASLQEKNCQLEQLIRTDALTGVLSRQYGLDFLDEEVARYHRYGTPVSVLHIDVDEFKLINDDYGHEAGDNALRTIAAYIEHSKRQVDKVVRYGGDEFLIILPETPLDAVESVCQRLQARPVFCQLRQDVVRSLTLSIGAASAANTTEDLIDAADLAMLVAKKQGKGQYHIYRGEMTPEARKQALLRLRKTRGAIRDVLCHTLDLVLAEIERDGDVIESRRELMVELGKKVSQCLQLSNEEWRTLQNTIHLTTFEKLNLCWEIASQPTKLTDQQFHVFRQTIQRNIALLQRTRFLDAEAEVLVSMYEWYDGTGLHGLKGEDIPLLSRVLGILWAYALLCLGGPHTAPYGREQAWKYIVEDAGTHFDPALIEPLSSVIQEYYADSHDHSSGNILLVDDYRETATLLAQRLSDVGYQVTLAHTISDARNYLAKQSWMVVLTDMSLPDGDGVELAVQQNPAKPSPATPVIMMSLLDDPAAIQKAQTSGACAYFVKPVRFGKLLKILAQCREASLSSFQVVSSTAYV